MAKDPNSRNHSNHDHHANTDSQPQKPLSGSKKVKNRNHSRSNHGEGS